MTKTVVGDLAALVDDSLPGWIEDNVDFATSMVDRITPVTNDDDRALVEQSCGYVDADPVATEPFSEWVIAGAFPAGRPQWEEAGVTIVDDVVPFEQRKLWFLNASHSHLAYAASIRGFATIDEAIADPECRSEVELLWDEASRHLELPGDAITDYRQALLARFSNPRMRDQLARIAADGSVKLPVRILPTVRAERAAGRLPLGGATTLAAWVLHLRGLGAPVKDPGAGPALEAANSGDLAVAVPAVLEMLDPGLGGDTALVDAVLAQAQALRSEVGLTDHFHTVEHVPTDRSLRRFSDGKQGQTRHYRARCARVDVREVHRRRHGAQHGDRRPLRPRPGQGRDGRLAYPGVPFYTDYLAMLDSGDVDAVVTCVPHYLHPEMGIAALRHGIHALVEKPAGVYTKQVRELERVRGDEAGADLRDHVQPAQQPALPADQGDRRRRRDRRDPADELDHHHLVAAAGVLRPERLAGHLGRRGRRRPGQPGAPPAGSAAVDLRHPAVGLRQGRVRVPPQHRRRGRGDRGPGLRRRRDRGVHHRRARPGRDRPVRDPRRQRQDRGREQQDGHGDPTDQAGAGAQ